MRRQRGFTIVELMIAMAFIAVLLLAIAGAIMQVGAVYNRGVTMKSVNQAGRVVIDDMKRAMSESGPLSAVYVPQSPDETTVIGGRLCTGVFSYVWNIGVAVNPDDPASQVNRYEGPAHENKQLRLVKIPDNSKQYCTDPELAVDASKAVELLTSGSVATGNSQTVTGNLAVQRFSIERLTNNVSTGSALYSITIVISDADREAILDDSCKPPNDDESNQEYCAVNEFTFTAQAGNGGGQ